MYTRVFLYSHHHSPLMVGPEGSTTSTMNDEHSSEWDQSVWLANWYLHFCGRVQARQAKTGFMYSYILTADVRVDICMRLLSMYLGTFCRLRSRSMNLTCVKDKTWCGIPVEHCRKSVSFNVWIFYVCICIFNEERSWCICNCKCTKYTHYAFR